MFDMRKFLKENLISGYWNDSFTEQQVNIFGMNYLIKGMITQGDFNEVLEAIKPQEIEE